MKVLIIHLTDIHIRDDHKFDDDQIINIAEKIIRHNPSDVYFAFGGDIVFSGTKSQFSRAEDLVTLLKELVEDGCDAQVKFVSTPGNHDVLYPPDFSRTREDIINTKLTALNVKNELTRFSNYFDFLGILPDLPTAVIELDAFDGKVFAVRSYEMKIGRVNLFLLNSALFSYFDPKAEIYNCEKGVMKLPDLLFGKFTRRKNDINILLMHYPFSYYDSKASETLNDFVDKNINVVLTGHEHKDSRSTFHAQHETLFVSTGEFDNRKQSRWSIISTTGSETFEIQNYVWNAKERVFDIENSEKRVTSIAKYSELPYRSDFIENFYELDTVISDNINDYFTFPSISVESSGYHMRTINSLKLFDELLEGKDLVLIEGGDSAGKTSLARFLHNHLSHSKLVLYADVESAYHIKGTEKFIKDIFRRQYEVASFESFHKVPIEQRVLLIDDFDRTGLQKRETIEELSKFFGKIILIYTDDLRVETNVRRTLIENLSTSSVVLKIEHFYKTKRKELIEGVVNALCVKSGNDKNLTQKSRLSTKITRILDSNLSLFSLTPFMIGELIKCIYTFGDLDDNKGIYSVVFSANTTAQLSRAASDLSITKIDPYYIILQRIAFKIVSDRKDSLNTEEVSKIIHEFNEKHDHDIIEHEALTIFVKSRILVHRGKRYFFTSKNYLAFFASGEYIKMANYYEDNKLHFDSLMNNIFMGVNDKILLFLAFSQQNVRILRRIIDVADNFTRDQVEFKLSAFDFLINSQHEISKFTPFTPEQIKILHEKEEENERKNKENDEETRFDVYKEAEFDEEDKFFFTGINYVKILSTILPSFSQSLEKDDQDKIVSLLYKIPNIILQRQFSRIQSEWDVFLNDLYDSLVKRIDPKGKGYSSTLDRIRKKLQLLVGGIARALMLGMYNLAAKRAVDEHTERKFLTCKTGTESMLQWIMFMSYFKSNSNMKLFETEIIKMYDNAKGDQEFLLKNCLSLIVRRYVRDNNLSLYGPNKSFISKFLDTKNLLTDK